MPVDTFINAIRTKYDFTDEEVDDIVNNTFWFDNPRILKGKNVLLVDGNFSKLKKETGRYLLADCTMAFLCGDKEYINRPDVIAFQDTRVYGEFPNHHHYVKKILFSRYKKIKQVKTDTNLLYITTGPREVPASLFSDIEQMYDGDFMLLSTTPNIPELSDRFSLPSLPVADLFEKFDTYIYTPTARRFDCSPRFIAECAWYGKQVIYHGIDYWKEDKGLYWRAADINCNLDRVTLQDDDAIIDLIKGCI